MQEPSNHTPRDHNPNGDQDPISQLSHDINAVTSSLESHGLDLAATTIAAEPTLTGVSVMDEGAEQTTGGMINSELKSHEQLDLLPAVSGALDSQLASLSQIGPEHGIVTEELDHQLAFEPLTSMELAHMKVTAALAEHEIALRAILANGTTEVPDIPVSSSIFPPFFTGESTAIPHELEKNPTALVPTDATLSLDPAFQEDQVTAYDLEGPQIRAFAKLEFDDGPFYMNTYSVELGRDVRAARFAFQREVPQRNDSRSSPPKSDETNQTPARVRRVDSGRIGGSVISESGGIMGVDESDPEATGKRKRNGRSSRRSNTTTSSTPQRSRKNSTAALTYETDYQSLAMASLSHRTSGAHPVDPLSLLPSPDECPLIPIHPPALAAETGGHKGISRKHVKIAFNFERHLFDLHIKGRNGAFVDDRWHAAGEIIPLKSGAYIQIGGVGLKFVLPDAPLGQPGSDNLEDRFGERHSAFSSFPYANDGIESDRSIADEDEDDEDEDLEMRLTSVSDDEDPSEEISGSRDDEEEEESMSEPQPTVEVTPPPPIIPVKRGPGRPPKNGIMSKKKQQELAKAAKFKEKERLSKEAAPPAIPERKVGRPRKDSRIEPMPPKPEKRKYTKRKVFGDQSSESPGGSKSQLQAPHSSDQQSYLKEKKERKPGRAPRSPSPVFDVSKLSPEELAKPQSSYVVLIHEALSNSRTGPMSLPQIYRAIERRYPYYKVCVTTNGWQSSVRHNLSQHHAFRKIERDGKGWMWGIVQGVSIEKEKKRRSSPPPAPTQHPAHQATRVHAQNPQPPVPPPGGQGMGPPPIVPPALPLGTALGPLPISSTFPPTLPRVSQSYQSPYAPAASTGTPPPQSHSTLAPALPTAAPPPPTPAPLSHPPSHPRPMHHATQTSQISHQTTRRPNAAPGNRPQSQAASISADVVLAVQNFKSALVKTMPGKSLVVDSAINRALGMSTKSTMPTGQEDPQERVIMEALAQLIGNFTEKAAMAAAAQNNPPGKTTASVHGENTNGPAQLLQYLQKAGKREVSSSSTTTPVMVTRSSHAGAGRASSAINGDSLRGPSVPAAKTPLNGDEKDSSSPEVVKSLKRERELDIPAEADELSNTLGPELKKVNSG